MVTAYSPKSVLRFGVFELDAATGELRKHGILLKLHPQPAKILVLLASRPNELVTREQLKETLWGQDTFVDFEQGLNSCVRQIRTALADESDNPRFIQTVPRQGYRFIAPVAPQNGSGNHAAVPLPASPLSAPRRMFLFATAMAVVIAALVAFYFFEGRQSLLVAPKASAGKIMLAVLPFANYGPDSEREYLA